MRPDGAWEARFAPLLVDQLRVKRPGQAGRSWYVDETYVKVCGTWCYLYRAIDADGNLVDSRLSKKRDMEAAKCFFVQALAVVGHAPERVTTDAHDSYPRAIRETLGSGVTHRKNPYLNNLLEQDHRGIKQRYYPMRGFGSFLSAAHFCRAFDELRQFFRFRTTMKQSLPLAQPRMLFCQRLDTLKALVLSAQSPWKRRREALSKVGAFSVLSSDTSGRSAHTLRSLRYLSILA